MDRKEAGGLFLKDNAEQRVPLTGASHLGSAMGATASGMRAAAAPRAAVALSCISESAAPESEGAGVVHGMLGAFFGKSRGKKSKGVGSADLSQVTLSRGNSQDDELVTLTITQNADGSFDAARQLLDSVNLDRARFEAAAKQLGAKAELANRIAATLLALHVLETNFAARRDEWKLLAEKAERWLAKQTVQPPAGFSDLKTWVKDVLKVV